MSPFSQLRLLYFCHLSNPPADRPIYRAIRRRRVRKIVELNIGDGRRALRMIAAAKLASPGREIHYYGLDRFEDQGGSAPPKLTLKGAHRLLRGDGVRTRLLPGIPSETLVRAANSLGKVDLLILPGELESPSFRRVWFFMPRMLHERSIVFVEREGADDLHELGVMTRQAIDGLAATAIVHRRAA